MPLALRDNLSKKNYRKDIITCCGEEELWDNFYNSEFIKDLKTFDKLYKFAYNKENENIRFCLRALLLSETPDKKRPYSKYKNIVGNYKMSYVFATVLFEWFTFTEEEELEIINKIEGFNISSLNEIKNYLTYESNKLILDKLIFIKALKKDV